MDLKHPKWAIVLFCALLLSFMGCENGATEDYTAEDLALTLMKGYSVAHPDSTGTSTNYVVLEVGKGDYTKGTYTLNGNKVTPTPVLTDGAARVIKIAVPAEATTATLSVKEGETQVLGETTVTFTAAGKTAPEVLYGEKAMAFSEFFHDVTADIAEVRPSITSFAETGYVAEPKKFINAGTRTGIPKWTETDAALKVDSISSATYGDSAHFVPTKNLAINYEDPQTKGNGHEVTGIKAVEVGVDFDLYANADILRQTGRAVAASTEVLIKAAGIAWKASTEVYKAKYLRPDASWGKRDQTAITESKAKAWPKAMGGEGGAKVSVSYGGTWADKVISVDFAPLPAGLDNAGIWSGYFDYVYAGYVEDLQTGRKEPLVWLQNLFSHKGHTNLEAAIQRAGFSRMDSLSPSGNFKLMIFAQGFEDIVVESVAVSTYDGQNDAAIEQGSTFYVSGTGGTADFKDDGGGIIAKELHVTGLSAAALADFKAKSGKLQKGGADDVPVANYELEYEEADGEIAITLKEGFFTGAFQGAYSFSINSDTVYKAIPFTVNRVIARPKLKQGNGTASEADAQNAITVTKNGGNITFDNEDFAKAIVVAGRSVSSIAPAVTGGITAVLKQSAGVYSIDAAALSSGDYTLTLVASNFVTTDLKSITPYYIKVQ